MTSLHRRETIALYPPHTGVRDLRKIALFAIGLALLLLVEVGYSLALQRYDLPGTRSPFFRGPITAIARLIFRSGNHHALGFQHPDRKRPERRVAAGAQASHVGFALLA